MQEDVLELRVKAAITSNKVIRLDNPMVNDKIKKLKNMTQAAMPGRCDNSEQNQ